MLLAELHSVRDVPETRGAVVAHVHAGPADARAEKMDATPTLGRGVNRQPLTSQPDVQSRAVDSQKAK